MIASLIAILPLLALTSASPITKRYEGVKIVSGRDGLCLAAAPKTGVGSPVESVDCNNVNYPQYWDINPGSGSVVLHGTGLALDAGSYPGNNGALKVWTSYPGLYQQTWYLTGDNRIAITGGNQCLDEGDNGIQTYQCTTGNTNQVFYIQPNGGSQPSSTSSATPSSTSSAAPSSTPSSVGGVQIHPNGNTEQCVAVQNGFAAVGTRVAISVCLENDENEYGPIQRWDVPADGSTGHVQLHGTNLCLDAGDDPSNFSDMKIWTCYDGLLQQEWNYSNQNLALSNGQCLDVKLGSTPSYQKPYVSIMDLQTYQCSPGDSQQIFTTSS